MARRSIDGAERKGRSAMLSSSSARDEVVVRRAKSARNRVVNLALQGGGSHGAFTWGVLDRLLEDERIEFEGISGTSAGAMNAVVMADGLVKGGRDGARQALIRFWESVASHAPINQLAAKLLQPHGAGTDGALGPIAKAVVALSRDFSPYQLNPFDLNPLRQIVTEQIDFQRLRAESELKLFVAATHVSTGKLRLFRNEEMSADALLASACMPSFQQAIEIDGEAYWDGGYSANPAVFPLFYECESPDVIVVLLHPLIRERMPHTAEEIRNRVSELGFNSTFLREMRMIVQATEQSEQALLPWGRLERRLRQMNFHLIEAEALVSQLAMDSKLNTHLPFITMLRDLGRAQADLWLANNFSSIGNRSSVDLAELFA
jgi:NTE family protein